MKIIHLTSVHDPTDTRIFEKYCESIAETENEVILVAPKHPNFESSEKIKYIPIPKIINPKLRLIISPFFILIQVIQNRADIYHFHDPELVPVFFILSLFGKKIVYDMHEDVRSSIDYKKWLPGFLKAPLKLAVSLVERLCLNRFFVIFAEDSYVGNYKFIKRWKIVRNFPRIQMFTEFKKKSPNREVIKLAYIGSVTKERGALEMIKVLNLLRSRNYQVELTCIGPVSSLLRSEMESLIHLGNEQSVRIMGKIPLRQALPILKDCSIGLALLHPEKNYINSYPTKVFEYLCLGIPVITSNFPLYKGIITTGEFGRCVDPLDVEAISQAILEMKDEFKDQSDRIMSKARKDFSWDTDFNGLIEVYKEISCA